ncbi:MAG: MerR family transcriptional regulator [Chloroflexota bacterium]
MEQEYKSPQDVSFQLDISPSTLRRWTDELAEFLSDEVNPSNSNGSRRYTNQDIERLREADELIKDGLTYEQVRQEFRQSLEMPAPASLITNDDAAASAVMSYISETIENMRQGQITVLNSQSANRELMGVVIQDNFNLKEENTRLRERMLDLERQVGEVRRDEMVRRESLRREMDMKLMEIRETVSQVQVAAQPAQEIFDDFGDLEDRPGCMARLFRRGPENVTPAPIPSAPPPAAPRPSPPRPPASSRPPGPPE